MERNRKGFSRADVLVVFGVVVVVLVSLPLLTRTRSGPWYMTDMMNLRSLELVVSTMEANYGGEMPKPSRLALDAGASRVDALKMDTTFGLARCLAFWTNPDYPEHVIDVFVAPYEEDPLILRAAFVRRDDDRPWFDITCVDDGVPCDVLGPMSYATTPLFGARASAWLPGRASWEPMFGFRGRRVAQADVSAEILPVMAIEGGTDKTGVLKGDGSVRIVRASDYRRIEKPEVSSNAGAPDHLYVNEADGTAEASDDLDQGNAFLAVVKSVTGSREIVGADGEVVVEPMISVGDLFWE